MDFKQMLINFRKKGYSGIIVYQMGRLCGTAHEISGIPAPICLCGWVIGWFMGWVGDHGGWVWGVVVSGGVGGVLVRGEVGGVLVRGGWVLCW